MLPLRLQLEVQLPQRQHEAVAQVLIPVAILLQEVVLVSAPRTRLLVVVLHPIRHQEVAVRVVLHLALEVVRLPLRVGHLQLPALAEQDKFEIKITELNKTNNL